MRRTTRARNGIRHFPRHRPVSLIELNNDVDGRLNISLDENSSVDADHMNFNVLDFMPNEQSNSFLNKNLRTSKFKFIKDLLKNNLILLLSILGVIISTALIAYGYTHIIGSTIFEKNNGGIAAKDCFCLENNKDLLMNMYTKMEHLNDKFRSVSLAFDYIIKLRNEMALSAINNKTLQENFALLEQVNYKIENALNLYDADKVGMIDYALESAGGSISSIPGTIPCPNLFSYDIFGIFTVRYSSNPRVLIQPGTLPGQCFAFKGQRGRIRIRLAHMIYITAITMEYVHTSLVLDPSSAPKKFKVYGLEKHNSEPGDELGVFQYKLNKKPLQIFVMEKLSSRIYRYVELQILTNHGNEEYTCVYRFRVHGDT